ncbi:D-alanyl-D-alanine carboxypeptidase [Streptomyces sp. ST1015]|nr:D-alanyl-D-alanine carboxypeptidase [Streptomyces sp. ST1015]
MGAGEADSGGSGERRTAADAYDDVDAEVVDSPEGTAGSADGQDNSPEGATDSYADGTPTSKADGEIVDSPTDEAGSEDTEAKSPTGNADSGDAEATEPGEETPSAESSPMDHTSSDSDSPSANTAPGDSSPTTNTSSDDNSPTDKADSGDAESKSPKGDADSGSAKGTEPGEKSSLGDNSPADKADPDGADTNSASTEDPSDDADPIDQPTAIFKAVRPKPNVDQPTTMLKLGDVQKPGTTDSGKPGDAEKPAPTAATGKAAGAAWTTSAAKKPDTSNTTTDTDATPKPGEANPSGKSSDPRGTAEETGPAGKTGAPAKTEGTGIAGGPKQPGAAGTANATTGTGAAAKTGTAAESTTATPKPGTAPKPDSTPKPGTAPKTDGAGKAAPGGRAGEAGKPRTGAGGDADADAERTSRFVALKPLDDPAGRKPRSSTGAEATATTAVPQVGPERTTQQPLPPKPPLDLLAELTNTPPPPPTPLRTLVRRVKIWTPLVILLAVVFAIAQMVRPLPKPALDLTAQSVHTFEGAKVDIPWPAQGQAALDVQGVGTFGSSGQEKPVPIASVAKVMTAYLILKDHPLKSGEDGPKIPIDQAAQDQSNAGQESTVNVTKGDAITQREALESILIASANNVARLLARWDVGSETAFVEKMNAAAKDLGMTNTTYTDPSGLNDTTVSTAIDQVKLGKAAMEQPVFREVAAMMSYTDYKGEYHSNWNGLVGKNKVVGIKTGTTTSALGNLMFAAKKEVGGETRTIIGAVVRQPAGGPENTILSAALDSGDKLIRAAQDVLTSATILKKGDVVGYVDDGLGGRTPVVVTRDVTAVGWPGLKVKLSFVAGDLPHTAKAGTQVATLTVGDGGSASAVKVPVALRSELAEPGFGAKLTRLG